MMCLGGKKDAKGKEFWCSAMIFKYNKIMYFSLQPAVISASR